jgi:cobalt-zinc-cadmium efflux system protein
MLEYVRIRGAASALTHEHGSGHPGHSHEVSSGSDQRRLLIALGLIGSFMAVEVVVGVVAGSLVLLSDAGHMLTDAGALGLGVVSIRLAAQSPAGGFTYGLKRAEILSGLANGVTLIVLAGLIAANAIFRLINPPNVQGGPVVIVAVVGIGINLIATSLLARANRASLNIQGSFLHIVTDLFAFIGTAVAGAVILLTGFRRADAIASLLVAALMLWAAQRLVRLATRALLEASPAGIDPEAVGTALAAQPHVSSVHDLHIWEITSGFPALSAHVLVHPNDDCHAIRIELETLLRERFDIEHTTLQVDHASSSVPVTLRTPFSRTGGDQR